MSSDQEFSLPYLSTPVSPFHAEPLQNTGDFANPGSTNLHAQPAASFNPVNLRYAVSLADAEGVLTAAGWVP
jgi:hypothetical protein